MAPGKKMLRSRQRFLWLIAIALVWSIGIYLVYQKASTSTSLMKWPTKKDSLLDQRQQREKEQFLASLGKLENAVSEDAATYEELNKVFMYFIKKKYQSKGTDAVNEGVKDRENVLPGPHDGQGGGGDGGIRIPVIVFACNRVSVSNCLDNLLKYRPSAHQFPIIVSQDCGDAETKEVILSYKENVTLIEQPDLSDIVVPPKDKKFKGYYKIARHYGWALNTVFGRGFEFVIIVEDDLNVAPDFFEYFMGTHKLLREDPSLWCISAWNDNGKEGLIDTSASTLLYRTDFFPGLGWMLSSSLWAELSPKWPKSFWDDWIRNPEQRKGRACIRPEISRTRTFGKIGVSNGLFFDKHLKYIKLGEDRVNFTTLDMSYLKKEEYDKTFVQMVYDCPLIEFDELRLGMVKHKKPVRIQYRTRMQYKQITKHLGLMDDFKSGVPRTSYRGIVALFYKGQRVFLAPSLNWKGYDPSWS